MKYVTLNALRLTLYLVFLISGVAQADILMVPSQYSTIQDGLNAASQGDTVLVAHGTYYEHLIWPGTDNIHLLSEAGALQTIIDGGNVDRVISITTTTGVGPDTEIRGFTIRNGYTPPGERGAGILCENSSPTIAENIITYNIGFKGSGIYCKYSNPLILNNEITYNDGYYGVGIGLRFSDPVITGNRISYNNAAGGWAAGIDCYDASPVIMGNTISHNYAYYNGVAIYCTRSDAVIQINDILYNTVGWELAHAGGIMCYDSPDLKINFNNIVGNYYGVWSLELDSLVNAEYNWWGDPTGPGGSGPGVIGDNVNEYVDYTPWLQESAPHIPVSSVPGILYGAQGDTISIPIMVSELLTGFGVLSAEFTLSFDPTIITGIDVDASGTLLSGTDWIWDYNVVGDTFFVTIAGTDSLAGSGKLINLIFVVSPDAGIGEESPLHFVDFMFNQGFPPVNTQDGVFIVSESFGALEGIVTDAATGGAITGAIVTAHGSHPYYDTCDTTDAVGHYLMQEVLPDTYNMTVKAFGYNQFDSTGIVVLPVDTTEINFAMLHPEIVVQPVSFDMEIHVGTTYDTTMTIINLGNGTLDFDIDIGSNSRLIKSIALIPETTIVKEFNSDTRIDNFDSEFEISPFSEGPGGIFEPSDISLTYRPAGEDTIHYDSDPNASVGLTHSGTFEAAIRLTPEELAPYDREQIISVLFYHYGSATHTGQIKIYGEGTTTTPYQPGQLITSEPYSVSGGIWLRTDLTEPVTINAEQDLWTSVEITHNTGEHPMGVDSGPAVQGKGDLIYSIATGWEELYSLNINRNWNIRAIVVSPWLSITPESGAIPAGQSLDVTLHFDTNRLDPDSTYTTSISIYNNSTDSLITIPVTLNVTPYGIDDPDPQVPVVFALEHNYPNPISSGSESAYGGKGGKSQTTISYTLPKPCKVSLKIYNIKGQLVETLVNEEQQPGNYSVVWNVPKKSGISSGVYFDRITAGDFTDTKKCVILK